MLIVRTFKYEGKYKIRCGCGNAIIGDAFREEDDFVITCKKCGNHKLLKNIPFLFNRKPHKWEILQNCGGSSSCYGNRIKPYKNQDDQFPRSQMLLKGQYGSFRY